MNKEIKFRMNVWFIFCLLYTISFFRVWNLEILRYLDIAFIQFLAIYDIIKKKKIIIDKKLLTLFFIISLSMVVSVFISKNFVSAIIKTLSIFDFFILTGVLLPNYLRNIRFRDFLICTTKSITVALLFSVIFFRNDYTYFSGTSRLGKDSRFYGGFFHPNILGEFTFIPSLSVVLLFFYYRNTLKIKEKVFLILSFILSLYIMRETDCRTTMIALILLLLLIVYDKIFKKFVKFKVVLTSVLILIVLLIGILYSSNLSFEKIDRLLSYRLSFILTSLENLNKNETLLFGNGSYRNSEFNISDGVLLDNGFMNIIYQYGIITFFLIAIYLYYITIKIRKVDQRNIIYILLLVFLAYNVTVNALINLSSLFNIYIYTIIFKKYIELKKDKN